MNWTPLTSLQQLQDINPTSTEHIVMIFKHSTRCSISDIAKKRLTAFIQSNIPDELNIKTFYVDLFAHRDVSDRIVDQYSVFHESPQVLLIRNGECFYESSHLDISAEDIIDQVNSLNTTLV